MEVSRGKPFPTSDLKIQEEIQNGDPEACITTTFVGEMFENLQLTPEFEEAEEFRLATLTTSSQVLDSIDDAFALADIGKYQIFNGRSKLLRALAFFSKVDPGVRLLYTPPALFNRAALIINFSMALCKEDDLQRINALAGAILKDCNDADFMKLPKYGSRPLPRTDNLNLHYKFLLKGRYFLRPGAAERTLSASHKKMKEIFKAFPVRVDSKDQATIATLYAQLKQIDPSKECSISFAVVGDNKLPTLYILVSDTSCITEEVFIDRTRIICGKGQLKDLCFHEMPPFKNILQTNVVL